jgi:YesN/AraC family two-component response regulator
MLFVLVANLYGEGASLTRQEANFEDPTAAYSQKPEAELTKQIIQKRYDIEKIMLEAVSEGDAAKTMRSLALFRYQPENLFCDDKLRNGKNYVIMLNTLLGRATGNGYVHPAHIDAVSSDFCRRIENAVSLSELIRLVEMMVRQYCTLVKKFSLRSYSPLVRNVINMVDFNLQEPLSVASLAKQFNTNPSNLSTQFRREKGIPLTKYINTKRLERAASFLCASGMSIQEIAEQCGFQDMAYFSHIFKRYYGKSPTKFRSDQLK